MRIAIEQGMHTDMESQYLAEDVVERARETWWSVYTLGGDLFIIMATKTSLNLANNF